MYRNGSIYDEIAKTVIQIYLDYGISSFPIDEGEVCRKMGVSLIGYSEMPIEGRKLLMKRSIYGFFAPETRLTPPTIYYNDLLESGGAKKFTIFHELKHYVYEDDNDNDDDLADYFAKYMMCPIPYLILKNIRTPSEVVSFCGSSYEAAVNVVSNINNRKKVYGYRLFDYEVSLIKLLEPVLLEVYAKE